MVDAERLRLVYADTHGVRWRRWAPYLYAYFHGDNGVGIGASHQTGWTGIAGVLPLLFRGSMGAWLRARGQAARNSGHAPSMAGTR